VLRDKVMWREYGGSGNNETIMEALNDSFMKLIKTVWNLDGKQFFNYFR